MENGKTPQKTLDPNENKKIIRSAAKIDDHLTF